MPCLARSAVLVCCLCACLLALLSNETAFASEAGDDSFSWTIDNDGKLSIAGEGDMPDFDEGSAPWGTEITQIDWLGNITSIGAYAFCDCALLETVQIPESVVSIGEGAFQYSGVQTVQLPESILTIETAAFAGCRNPVFYAAIGSSSAQQISKLGFYFQQQNAVCKYRYIFDHAGTVTELEAISIDHTVETCTIPLGVTRLADNAFKDHHKLQSIDLPNTLKEIGKSAFQNCDSLEHLEIPDQVILIEDHALSGCTKLSMLSLPMNLESLGAGALLSCSSIRDIEINDKITQIEEYTFYGMTSLINVIIPDSVTSIGKRAFDACPSLHYLAIPDSVITLDDPFYLHGITLEIGCTSDAMDWVQNNGFELEGQHTTADALYRLRHSPTVAVHGTNATCTDAGLSDQIICEKCGAVLEQQTELEPLGHLQDIITYTWAENLTSVTGTLSCSRCHGVQYEETVTTHQCIQGPTNQTEGSVSIQSDPFEHDSFTVQTHVSQIIPPLNMLTVCKLPDGVRMIEAEAFAETSFQAILIPEGCEVISSRAFANCKDLRYIFIPSSVTRIAEDAFLGSDLAVIDHP